MGSEVGSVLGDAKTIITVDRMEDYGRPEICHQMIADFWNVYLRNGQSSELENFDVANMMILMKVARARCGGYKRDSFIDICGYADLASYMKELKEARK